MSIAAACCKDFRVTPAPMCCTPWPVVIASGLDDATRAWLVARPKQAEDRLLRSTTMLAAADAGHIVFAPAHTMPLRWDGIAMNGLAPFRRCLHGSAAWLYTNDALKAIKEGRTASACQPAGRAVRHLAAAGGWAHDVGSMPTALAPATVARATLLVNALAADKLIATGASGLAGITRRVGLLQTVLASESDAKATKAVAETALARELLLGYARHRRDTRPGAPPGEQSEHEAATAASMLSALVDPDAVPASVSKFIAVTVGAHGGVDAAAARRLAENGLLQPLINHAALAARYGIAETSLTEPIELRTAPFQPGGWGPEAQTPAN